MALTRAQPCSALSCLRSNRRGRMPRAVSFPAGPGQQISRWEQQPVGKGVHEAGEAPGGPLGSRAGSPISGGLATGGWNGRRPMGVAANGIGRESATPTAAALLGVLGVVYGDIGTSPLYAIKAS